MIPIHRGSWFTFRFGHDRIIPRFHLDGVEAGRPVSGGHFATWEQPELFSVELHVAFRSLRESSFNNASLKKE